MMWLWQWVLRHFKLSPQAKAFGDYCEKIVNGSLEDTIDEYEEYLKALMKQNEMGRYQVAMRIMVFNKVVEYVHENGYC